MMVNITGNHAYERKINKKDHKNMQDIERQKNVRTISIDRHDYNFVIK